MRFCKRCVEPDTRAGIVFDEDGVCNICRNIEQRESIDWEARRKELQKIAEWAKEHNTCGYDCVVGASGGKDSTKIALTAKEELGLNVLLVNTVPDGLTDIGRSNMENLMDFGFDCLLFKPNPKVCKILAKRAFYEYGNPVKPSEYVLYATPLRVAINYKIPIVFFGENPVLVIGDKGEVGESGDGSRIRFLNTLAGGNASDWYGDGIDYKEVLPYQIPSEIELEEAGVRVVFMGYYLEEFSPYNNAQFALERGLKVRTDHLHNLGRFKRYQALDDDIVIVNQLLKYIKLGVGNASDEACYEIREGRMMRDEAIRIVKEYDGLCGAGYIRKFCDYINISVEEFWRVANTFRGKMWEQDPAISEWKLKNTLWDEIEPK